MQRYLLRGFRPPVALGTLRSSAAGRYASSQRIPIGGDCLRQRLRLQSTAAKPRSFNPRAAQATRRSDVTASGPGGSYNPLIQQLAQRTSPILIYQSESKGPYITGCFMLGGGLIIAAVSNMHTITLDPLVEPTTLVTLAFGVGSAVMAGFGGAAFYRTFRIIRSVTIVPMTCRSGQRSLLLRLEYGNLRSKTIDVPYEAVTTSERLFAPPTAVSAQEKLRQLQLEKARWEESRQRILTLPFRQAGHWIYQGYLGFKRIVSDDGWIFLRVKGRRGRWKLHEKPAWALRGGKHLDDLTRRA